MNDANRLPLEIGIISTIHMIIGFTTAIDIILNLLQWGIWSFLRINIIFAFIGIELLRHKKTGRNGTYLLSVLFFLYVLFCSIISLLSNIGWFHLSTPSLHIGQYYYNYPEWYAWLFLIGLTLLSLWMIFTIRRYDNLGYFANHTASENQKDRRTQRSQKHDVESSDQYSKHVLTSSSYVYIFVAIILSLVMKTIPMDQLAAKTLPKQRDYSLEKHRKTEKEKREYNIYYGQRFGDLAYVVFHIQDRNKRNSDFVQREGRTVKLKLPDEDVIYLPGDYLIHQIEGKTVQKENIDITINPNIRVEQKKG